MGKYRKKNRKRTGLAAAAAAILYTVSAPAVLSYSQTTGCLPPVHDDAVLYKAMESRKMPSRDTIVLRFIGDVMLHQAQIDNAAKAGGGFDFSDYFSGLEDDLKEADLSVANMEFTLAGEPYTGYPSFSAPDEYAEYLAGCGIDIFLTANNHILDKGRRGLDRTLSVYRSLEDKYGIRMTGSAENPEKARLNYPLIINVDGLRISFINFTYGTNSGFGKPWPGTFLTDKDAISNAISRSEELGAGLIIALPHWGEEYDTRHSVRQENLAGWLASEGADIIIGTHPHVVQDAGVLEIQDERGEIRDVPVFYSLGNAISNMSAPDTQIGLMLSITVYRNSYGDVECIRPECTFIWSSLPGRLKDSHTAVKVKDCIGHRDRWKMKYEYDKMISTYYRIKESTELED